MKTDKKSKKYTISMPEEEKKKIQKLANKYTDGNFSKMLVLACLNYKTKETK